LSHSHPCWKLYKLSNELRSEIIYTNTKHDANKVYFRISNVHVPRVNCIYDTIKTHRGPEYSTGEIFALTGNEEPSSDNEEL
jgi:hypothetical protein